MHAMFVSDNIGMPVKSISTDGMIKRPIEKKNVLRDNEIENDRQRQGKTVKDRDGLTDLGRQPTS